MNQMYDICGFKICVNDLISEGILPEFFNSPLMLSWEITRKCNLRCIHCYNNSKFKKNTELSKEQKKKIAKQIVKMKVLRACISGGEPILDDSFWDIAEILKEGKICCNTITNGYRIDSKNANKMSLYFNHVQVSIDAATQTVHDRIRGLKGSWEKAILACKHLSDNNTPLWICFVPLKWNIDQVGDMIDLSYQLGAKAFRTEMTKPTGRAAINRHLMPSDKDYEKFNDVIQRKKIEYKNDMTIEYIGDYQESDSIVSQNMPPMHCWITPSGFVKPNNTLPFHGGTLINNSLDEIWEKIKRCNKNRAYINILKQVKNNNDLLKLSEIPYQKIESVVYD